MISFGAGVNSVAMTILLFKRGQIMPVVFADTMAEHPETYCYMDYFEREFMSKYGQKIIRLHPEKTPNYYRKDNRKSIEVFCLEQKIIPFHRNRFCTLRWKVEPLKKYTNNQNIFIGFAYDERNRAKGREDFFPLIEEKITRKGCREIIRAGGLAMPRKSGCWFCPFQRISEWEDLYRNHRDLFERAVAMEKNTPKEETTFRFDKSLTELKERFKSKGGDLFPDFDFEELTPCQCLL